MKHFSPKWKRELVGDENANHIDVPFQKEPVKLIVSWMILGVGDELGTGTDLYPKTNSNNLEILKRLTIYLELDQLTERVTKGHQTDCTRGARYQRRAKDRQRPYKSIHPAGEALLFLRYARLTSYNSTVDAFPYSSNHITRHIQRNCPERNAVFKT